MINEYNKKKNVMKTEQIERHILSAGLEPVEVRLSNGHVKWFLCKEGESSADYSIIVYADTGEAYGLEHFKWPENAEDIIIRWYMEESGYWVVLINNRRADRIPFFDLDT